MNASGNDMNTLVTDLLVPLC